MHNGYHVSASPWYVTFDSLLRMQTAIPFGSDSSWSPGIMPTTDEMFDAIGEPADPPRMGQYQNGNFTMIRVLIGEIEYDLDDTDQNYNRNTADAYLDYIKKNIFDPINVDARLSVNEIQDYFNLSTITRAHQFPFYTWFRDDNNEIGWAATSDPTKSMGSGGLVLTTMDLAKLLAYFMHTNGVIISESAREKMLDRDLGLWGTGYGKHGKYSSKGGKRGADSYERSIKSYVMMFPNGVEAALIINSHHPTPGSILRIAFDEAWVSPCD